MIEAVVGLVAAIALGFVRAAERSLRQPSPEPPAPLPSARVVRR